ncbi:hypothetical protein QFX18_01685 [Saccharophagus degradans]|uniref:hypothetical protein n=1 Tax=Saccharophagus degradans TaxID=86304 RepID=UPI002477EC28|nr:hypothetical protein [Saccharophagus degradans]WGO98771.1 hypothetical protein QFX18_01685 [Saccharophagus degradans]
MSKKIDAYTQHVMSRIDPDVFKTLNIVQLEAIRTAISANAPFRQHSIDLRGTIPLYFSKLYFVFLIGKDRRSDTRNKENMRIKASKGISFVMFLYTLLAVLTPIILIILYGLKTLAGIDIFPDSHLEDLIPK